MISVATWNINSVRLRADQVVGDGQARPIQPQPAPLHQPVDHRLGRHVDFLREHDRLAVQRGHVLGVLPRRSPEDLHGHGAVEDLVAAKKDPGHTAGAKLPDENEPPAETVQAALGRRRD